MKKHNRGEQDQLNKAGTQAPEEEAFLAYPEEESVLPSLPEDQRLFPVDLPSDNKADPLASYKTESPLLLQTTEILPLPAEDLFVHVEDTELHLGPYADGISHISKDPSEEDYIDPGQFVRASRKIKATPLDKPHTQKNKLLNPSVFIVAITLIVFGIISYILFVSPESQERLSSPLTLNGKQVSNAEFSFMYHYVLLENGIDINKVGTDKQLESPGDEGFSTYREYFLDMAAREMQVTEILYDEATSKGYSISDTQKLRAKAYIDWLTGKAAEIGVDIDTYVKGYFGNNVTVDLITDMLSKRYFTEDYANGPKLEELKASELQAEDAYLQASNQYDIVSYRVLRIVFEQADESFKETAQLRAQEIIDGIGHDQTKFESVASNFFSGEAKDKLLLPDSTLVSNVRYNEVENPEWRAWLYDPSRTPGDCTIFNDDKGFPILFCFSSRSRQMEPLRDIRLFYINREDLEAELPGIPANEIVPIAQTIFDSITDEASVKMLETTYADELKAYQMKASHNMNTYPGVLPQAFDAWIFDPARLAGDKTMLETETQIVILYYVASSANPEWFDRVNSFIRMNNYQAFLLEKTTEYPYTLNADGIAFIKDVPSIS